MRELIVVLESAWEMPASQSFESISPALISRERAGKRAADRCFNRNGEKWE